MRHLALAALAIVGLAHAAPAQTLRVGLQSDPEILDPVQGTSFVGRIVYAALCDKLIDVDEELSFVPQLATSWAWSADRLALTLDLRPGVVFHDGEPFDAAAAKFSIDRGLTAKESKRKGELNAVSAVCVLEPLKLEVSLKAPYAPLLSVLADRAGMMMSPKAVAGMGEKFGTAPVCAGPFSFKERVAGDRIVLDRFDRYWNKDAIKLDRILYRPIVDSAIRLANLRSGDLDIITSVSPTDVSTIESDDRVRLASAQGPGYQNMSINLDTQARPNSPLAKSALVREAFELSIDRQTLVNVVFDGRFAPTNQPFAVTSRWYAQDWPVPQRDIPRAKALLAEAGIERPAFSILFGNSPELMAVTQVMQSMAAEAGFEITLEPVEATTMVANAERGNYDTAMGIWSGRVDPDHNVSIWLACDGFVNRTKFCDPKLDAVLQQARQTIDEQARKALYDEAASIYLPQRPILFLYSVSWLWGLSRDVQGFVPYPDGLIRPQGITLD